MDDTSRILLKLENISKSFAKVENDEVTHALDQINLEMESGEFISLVGPSGCGKSTILRLVAGLIRQSNSKWRRDHRAVSTAWNGLSEANFISLAYSGEKHCLSIKNAGKVKNRRRKRKSRTYAKGDRP